MFDLEKPLMEEQISASDPKIIEKLDNYAIERWEVSLLG